MEEDEGNGRGTGVREDREERREKESRGAK